MAAKYVQKSQQGYSQRQIFSCYSRSLKKCCFHVTKMGLSNLQIFSFSKWNTLRRQKAITTSFLYKRWCFLQLTRFHGLALDRDISFTMGLNLDKTLILWREVLRNVRFTVHLCSLLLFASYSADLVGSGKGTRTRLLTG